MIKRVGIDLDNTVADYMALAVPLLEKYYNLKPDYNSEAYRIEEVFGLTPETRPEGMREFLYERLRIFRKLPKLEEDNHLLTWELSRMDVKVYFITARSPTDIIVGDTIYWLQKNNFKFEDIFFTPKKAQLCELMEVDVMLEDELAHIFPLTQAGIYTVIIDRPWNRNFTSTSWDDVQAARIYGWKEALQVIKARLR